MTTISRRKAVFGAAATVVVGIAAIGGLAVIGPRIATLVTDTSANSPHHETELRIPPLYEGEVADGVRHFALSMQEGKSQFLADKSPPAWGVNGDFLRPTLRAPRGDTVQIEVQNNLPEKSALHWHGASAGKNGCWIPPGHPARRKLATHLGYHPACRHALVPSASPGDTADHTWNGIAGMFIIDDDVDVSLPEEYGVDDIPLVIQDRAFNVAGDFDRREYAFGYFGDHILVNGTY